LVFISAVVIWEIRIKQSLGKLELPHNFRKVLDSQPFEQLDITVEHAHAVGDLPAHHRDPFDRMLVAQTKVEHLTLVTRDIGLKKYKIPIIEA
ncbi:MAG: type II toxin-antitoxin system VapC family toxin, partial [Deltaproteobacteria bacterium]|nr:type II toxin-antitoxin system VapC family toxin [Deltaproteobacteria bacterium]